MISDTLQAMMAGYVVKTAMHAVLGIYMWYWNRRWNKQAKADGTEIPEDERRKRAEEVGMVSACIDKATIGMDHGADLPQTDATEFRESSGLKSFRPLYQDYADSSRQKTPTSDTFYRIESFMPVTSTVVSLTFALCSASSSSTPRHLTKDLLACALYRRSNI
jgi:hypothetical protein